MYFFSHDSCYACDLHGERKRLFKVHCPREFPIQRCKFCRAHYYAHFFIIYLTQSTSVLQTSCSCPRSIQSKANSPLRCRQCQPPCHHSSLCLRRTRHCHPRPRDHICAAVSLHPTPHQARNPYVSVSLILALSGNSPYAFKLLASSALYLSMTSPFSSW